MRAFAAIEVPEDIKARLQETQCVLRESKARASWVKPDAMHITLRFLGEIGDAAAETFVTYAAPRFAGLHAFELTVAGIGAFPNARKPSVVWAGIAPAEGPLEAAFRIAEEGAIALGQKAEGRRFHPHVTLARVKDAPRSEGSARGAPDPKLERLAAAIGAAQGARFGAFTARSVSLFSSDLTPQGPIYTRIKEFRFSP